MNTNPNHTETGEQGHHHLQLRQLEILPAQRHLYPLLQFGQTDQEQAAVAQAQGFLVQSMAGLSRLTTVTHRRPNGRAC